MRATAGDGLVVNLRDLGGEGRPVLLAHAFSFHGGVWEPLARRLGARCFALDLRAHGESPLEHGESLAWAGFARDVLACADAIGADGLVGVGHSGGGAALLLAELLRPGTFAALYLYEPAAGVATPELRERARHMAAAARRRRDWFPSAADAEAVLRLRAPLKSFAPDALRAYIDGAFGPGPQGTVRLRCTPEDEARIYELGPAGLETDAGAIDCPVEWVTGERTERFRHEAADPVRRRLPRRSDVVLPGLGHFGPLEDPAAVAASAAALTLAS